MLESLVQNMEPDQAQTPHDVEDGGLDARRGVVVVAESEVAHQQGGQTGYENQGRDRRMMPPDTMNQGGRSDRNRGQEERKLRPGRTQKTEPDDAEQAQGDAGDEAMHRTNRAGICTNTVKVHPRSPLHHPPHYTPWG